MDQWLPAEFKLLSEKACDALAEMFNCIEEGAKWPEQTTKARAAFLTKGEESDLDPLSYRVLLMLATAYRTWAKTRLEQLHPWIKTWAVDEIYAGVEGQGANDAAYTTAVEIELCRLLDIDYSGGAADIFKCFDQVQRPIVYKVLQLAGMPARVLSAYQSFQEAVMVRNTVDGGLGEEYSKPTSVPQGDPMSMMVTSLLLRAWVMQMKAYAVKPRVLADDLQILSQGLNHLKNFEYAFSKTHKHIEDLGGRLAPKKSITFASDESSRIWLRNHKWKGGPHHTSHHRWKRPGSPHERRRQQDPRDHFNQENGSDGTRGGKPEQGKSTI